MIFVVDFGSQTSHLIARRIKGFGVLTKIVNPQEAYRRIKEEKPQGIILSGGPSSVYQKKSPTINKEIFDLRIPILGICYGFQLATSLLGGKVIPGKKEYGPASLKMGNGKWEMGNKLPQQFTVWMSHGDEVIELPKGFKVIGSSDGVPFAFVGNEEKKIYGVQFHPEVEHTEYGSRILKNFINLCDAKIQKREIDIEKIQNKIKEEVGSSYAIGAVSGGVDSTVVAVLVAKIIGKKFIPIYVDNGLMRPKTDVYIKKIFKSLSIKPIIVNVRKEMLKLLKGVTDSEQKRKIIGNFYIRIFEKEMRKQIKKGNDVRFLLQGTIYSDVIESQGTKHSAKIKSHHNVGGLPKKMKLKLLEPMRSFYKDEVREIGRKLGLPEEFINKQPFPGPGFAVRIRGEVTRKRLEMEKKADEIVLSELEKTGILQNVFLSFPVLTNAFSTAVKGDGRNFGEVVAIRIVESKDIMTSTWARIPYDLMQKISSRIVNEVEGVSRVVYDITTKPPATMEWE
ncbi:MAG: glutamine-hydrolyzing GMP synthase [Candidatus Levybacteria bacterium]|nr:glutamine-hydrolyzing GMP synthase [Candidatus Levybacteria bacterium]